MKQLTWMSINLVNKMKIGNEKKMMCVLCVLV